VGLAALQCSTGQGQGVRGVDGGDGTEGCQSQTNEANARKVADPIMFDNANMRSMK
jgi:hypothetical protein